MRKVYNKKKFFKEKWYIYRKKKNLIYWSFKVERTYYIIIHSRMYIKNKNLI